MAAPVALALEKKKGPKGKKKGLGKKKDPSGKKLKKVKGAVGTGTPGLRVHELQGTHSLFVSKFDHYRAAPRYHAMA